MPFKCKWHSRSRAVHLTFTRRLQHAEWFKKALTKRNLYYHIPNIPKDVPGRVLIGWNTSDYVDKVCGGHREAGILLHKEFKSDIESHLATFKYLLI